MDWAAHLDQLQSRCARLEQQLAQQEALRSRSRARGRKDRDHAEAIDLETRRDDAETSELKTRCESLLSELTAEKQSGRALAAAKARLLQQVDAARLCVGAESMKSAFLHGTQRVRGTQAPKPLRQMLREMGDSQASLSEEAASARAERQRLREAARECFARLHAEQVELQCRSAAHDRRVEDVKAEIEVSRQVAATAASETAAVNSKIDELRSVVTSKYEQERRDLQKQLEDLTRKIMALQEERRALEEKLWKLQQRKEMQTLCGG